MTSDDDVQHQCGKLWQANMLARKFYMCTTVKYRSSKRIALHCILPTCGVFIVMQKSKKLQVAYNDALR